MPNGIEPRAIFRQVLGFAVEIQKSVVIHCRNAEKQTLQILEEFPDLPGVLLHCFGGPEKFIQRGLQNGWYFTIPTSIAFKKIHQDLARMVPLGTDPFRNRFSIFSSFTRKCH